MFKKIFQRIFMIISQPVKTWNFLSAENDKEEIGDAYLKNYVYPIFGIITLAAFVGVFINGEFEQSVRLEKALLQTIKIFLILFSGFFLASYSIDKLMVRNFFGKSNVKHCQRFVGYSSSLIYALIFVFLLFPGLRFFAYIFALYTFYIVWEGSLLYMHIKEEVRVKFTALIAMIVLFSPFLIEIVLNLVFNKGLGEIHVLF